MLVSVRVFAVHRCVSTRVCKGLRFHHSCLSQWPFTSYLYIRSLAEPKIAHWVRLPGQGALEGLLHWQLPLRNYRCEPLLRVCWGLNSSLYSLATSTLLSESSSEPPRYPFYSLTFSSFWTTHYGLHFHASVSVIFYDFEKCTSLDCIDSCWLTSHFTLPPMGTGF